MRWLISSQSHRTDFPSCSGGLVSAALLFGNAPIASRAHSRWGLAANTSSPPRRTAAPKGLATDHFFSIASNRFSKLLNAGLREGLGLRVWRKYTSASCTVRTDLGIVAPAALAWPPPWSFSATLSASPLR